MMKSCGKAMRRIAIIAFIGLCICNIISYAISMDEVSEDRDSYAEDFAEHRVEIRREEAKGKIHEEDECSTCEKEENLDQSATVYFSVFVQGILTHLLYCSILFVLGEMAVNKAKDAADAAAVAQPQYQPQPQEPAAPATVACPYCGNVVEPNQRFCNKCGTQIQG